MQKRRQKSSGGASGLQHLSDVIQAARTTGGDHRHAHRIGNGCCEFQVIPLLGSVAIHGSKQQFTCAALHHLLGPCDGVEARVLAASFDIDIPATASAAASIDGHHDALGSKLAGPGTDQLRIFDRRGIEADLVGTRAQQCGDAIERANPTTNGERNKQLRSRALHQLHQGFAALVSGGDIEKYQFIGARSVVAAGQLHRIAGITQADEIHPFHHAAGSHVEAGNDPFSNHSSTSSTKERDGAGKVAAKPSQHRRCPSLPSTWDPR